MQRSCPTFADMNELAQAAHPPDLTAFKERAKARAVRPNTSGCSSSACATRRLPRATNGPYGNSRTGTPLRPNWVQLEPRETGARRGYLECPGQGLH